MLIKCVSSAKHGTAMASSFKRADGSALSVVTEVQEGYCRQTFTVVLYTIVPALKCNYRYSMQHHRQCEHIESAKSKPDEKEIK